MKANKQNLFLSTAEWQAWFNDLPLPARGKSGFIRDAIEEKARRDFPDAPQPPVAMAPDGVRTDARPMGWRSRLYRDRYQIVARHDGKDWIFQHFHEDENTGDAEPFGIIRAETPYPAEIVVYCPATFDKENVAHDLSFEIMLEDWQYLFDREPTLMQCGWCGHRQEVQRYDDECRRCGECEFVEIAQPGAES
jgi:hypothetical protein